MAPKLQRPCSAGLPPVGGVAPAWIAVDALCRPSEVGSSLGASSAQMVDSLTVDGRPLLEKCANLPWQ